MADGMVTQALRCERHGEPTRLTCVQCEKPICPKCLVRTEVGLKCEACAQPASAPGPSGLRRSRVPLAVAASGLVVLAVLAAVLLLRPSESGTTARPAGPPVGRWLD
ncbi:MAG TPA: B-box zinc finger protein, partial [Acidimicrobiales bacterium]|nr:B-box zinc finger protein [Acidimicrobiales bacterium]